MTNEELNAAIATRVMGWTLIDRLSQRATGSAQGGREVCDERPARYLRGATGDVPVIYLILIDKRRIAIAACEDEQHAAPYRARGYFEVTAAAYSAAWKERDRQTRQERAVGEPVKAKKGRK